MDKSKIGLFLSGAALTIGGVFTYLYFKDSQLNKEKAPPKISKQEAFKVIKDLKNQMLTISLSIIEKRVNIMKKLEQGYRLPLDKGLEDYVLEIADSILASYKKLICSKYNVEVKDFDKAIFEDYINDKDIVQMKEEIDEMFNNACAGIQPSMELDQEILDFLTREKVYNINIKFLRLASKKYIKAFQEMRTDGETEMSLDNPKFLQKSRELKISESKKEMLLNEGFDRFPDSPRELFDKVTHKYRQEDIDFSQRLQKIESTFAGLIDKLADNPFQFDETSPDLIFQEY